MSPAKGRSQTVAGDSLIHLNEVVVSDFNRSSSLKTDSAGATVIDVELLNRLPKILGNADPLRIIQSLPGVHTNSEYDSGLHINGDETSHTIISQSGAPVYGATHLLGLFSVFNPSHFSSMRIQRNGFASLSQQRLGAEVEMMLPDDIPEEKLTAEGSVGLMSSQGTIRVKPTSHSLLLLSARRSYLNLLYGNLLEMDMFALKYGFGDYNVSLINKLSSRDLLRLNLYYGDDAADMKEYNYQAKLCLRWGNALASAEWKHAGRGYALTNRMFFTTFNNKMSVEETALRADMTAGITDIGYCGALEAGRLSASWGWNNYRIKPQTPNVEGFDNGVQAGQHSHSDILAASAAYRQPIGCKAMMVVGTKVSAYFSGRQHYYGVDPYLSFKVKDERLGDFEVSSGILSQYLWQTGFSNRGLPTEFWISPKEAMSKPQRAFGIDCFYAHQLLNGKYQIELRGYYKRLCHQIEYKGDILELINSYNLPEHLLYGKGKNVGASLMAHKRKGRLTGWLSYSWQRLRRTFDRENWDRNLRANHERPHEINALATYRINERWDIGANCVFASGTPFTVAREMYLMNGALVTQYGKHNGARLPDYFRLDLSANYQFKQRRRFTHGINFSLYNATANSNVIFYMLQQLKTKENSLIYRAVEFALPIMPSVSYYFKF